MDSIKEEYYEKKSIFEQNPKKTIVLIVFSALVISDITAAGLYKQIFGYAFGEKEKYIHKLYRVKSDIYHHGFAKNVYIKNVLWRDREYVVATDSLGFRSEKQKDTPLKSKKYRIIIIGDSFTEGIGVRYQDTFAGRIAAVLSERNIEVLNAAVASYSPIIYYRKVKYLLDQGLKFNELVVFIDISDIEDEAIYYEMSPNNTVSRQNRGEKKKRGIVKAIKKNSIIYKFILLKYGGYINPKDKLLTSQKRSMWTIDENIFIEYGKEGLKKAEFYMDQLYCLLNLNNIPLTIAVYPWPDQIVNNDLDSIQVKHWQKWAQEKQVRFVNYFPYFINQVLQNEISSNDILHKYYIEGDVHFNEEGHALIANEFISFYRGLSGAQLKLLPQADLTNNDSI